MILIRLTLLSTIIILMISIIGCGTSNTSLPHDELILDGISLLSTVTNVVNIKGNPDVTGNATSTYWYIWFNPYKKVYFSITSNIVQYIRIEDNNLTGESEKGIKLNDTNDRVLEVYGNPSETTNSIYTYDFTTSQLRFYLELSVTVNKIELFRTPFNG